MNTEATILIVDDDQGMQDYVETLLDQLGFASLLRAGNGKAALEAIKTDRVDVVISDWQMPEMDGLEMVRQIRASEKFGNLPVIIMSSRDKPEHVATARADGASEYLAKPFNVGQLRQKLSMVLAE